MPDDDGQQPDAAEPADPRTVEVTCSGGLTLPPMGAGDGQ